MIEVQKELDGQSVAGRYPLIEILGATQHSSVFRTQCEDALNGHAAIKLITAPAATSSSQLARWRLAARFSHPALLRIFDMGRCDFGGRPTLYVVMELAEENLSEILPVRCLSAGEVDAMLGPALDALAYLHGKGFAHGHLRPSNILAIGDQLKLSSDSIVRIGEAAGISDPLDTYCALENKVSAASDVWSLGVTILHCLTGRLPQRVDPQARGSVSIPPNIPARFLDVARHCLNPVPQRRWSVAQLQSALGHGAVQAPAAPKISAAGPGPANILAVPAVSTFSKPDAAVPLRRRFRLERKYQLALAGIAAAVGAFVLGVVISGSGSDSSVTASAPVAARAASSRPTQPANGSVGSASVAPQPREFATNSAAPVRPSGASPDSKSVREFSSAHRAHSDAPGAAVIVTAAAPAASVEVAPSASSASADVIPGAVSLRAVPRVPASASRTITGTVRVSVIVDVDPRGHVVEAKPDLLGPSRYFGGLSMAAAKDWKFTPPRVDGNVVPSEWVIDFGYSSSGAFANASERHP